MTRIAYVVHDLGDSAVARRVTMLRAAGAEVTLLGFRRGVVVPAEVAGARAIDLGKTHDARLIHRLASVLRRVVLPGAVGAAVRGADVVIARNLESLAIAARVRRRGQRLVYECLDIHRTLLGTSRLHRIIQRAEAALLRRIDALIVSSPAFVREHFAHRMPSNVPVVLVENKWLAIDMHAPAATARPAGGPPWTIGWFGNLRCRRTLAALSALAAGGAVEVLIAGRPSPAEFDDFEGVVARTPGLRFVGAYTPADLPRLYGECHFAWAIDWFEEGLNSSWLLPNRLYEAAVFGVVPVALAGVETGRRLDELGGGLIVEDAAELAPTLAAMTAERYAALAADVARIPRTALVADRTDCTELLKAVTGA